MLIPLRNNILVAALDDPDTWSQTSSLIIRPESTKDRSDQGIVKAVGPEVREIQVGDYVTFSPYSGTVINDGDEGNKLIMLAENGVFARITPPNTPVPGVFLESQDGLIPATAESLILLLRASYQKMPRILELKHKFEQRLRDMKE